MNLTNLNTIVTSIAIIVGIIAITLGAKHLTKKKRSHKQSIKNSMIHGDVIAGDKNVKRSTYSKNS